MTPPALLVYADDLSGAAETAALLGTTTRVVLWPRRGTVPELHLGHCDLVIDTDSRGVTPAQAHFLLRTVDATMPVRPAVIFKKIDSLLRGNVRAEIAALLNPSTVAVLCPALPAAGRVTVDGVVQVGGTPLHQTSLWQVEPTPPPTSIVALLDGLPTATCTLSQLRTGQLPTTLAAARGSVVVCDAETMADLRLIADAVHTGAPAIVIGASALGQALAGTRHLADPSQVPSRPRSATPTPGRRRLTVIGTAATEAREQVRLLLAGTPTEEVFIANAELVTRDPDTTAAVTSRLTEALARGDVVITRDDADRDLPITGHELADRLARLVVAVVADDPLIDLVILGGESARATLDHLNVRELRILTQAHPGAVVSTTTPGDRRIVTRPGSFGSPTSLLTIHDTLTTLDQPTTPEEHSMTAPTTLPYVAVTMGDGAGVGPECTVAALLDPQVQAMCVPVVIGDRARLQQAATILGRDDADIVAIDDVSQAVLAPRRINVIDLGLLPQDLPWGELSATAGDAAYHYIKVAAQLASDGAVQAICTAPLNKEALHMGGHKFPGHTEMLAALTDTPEVSMMLTTPTLRVIHVTTHIGLVDAVAKIEPGLVERTVRRGYDALRRAGIENPHIGVLAINPHAGEGGLFGHGEEEEKIIPAIKALQADGIDAVGPMPADTAFYLGGRGDYDLLVAMYHDQGHGPVKVLGIEAGVNITVGLPVIRTSVDHGTAFDIAGKGVVKTESMVEAMRQAVALAAVGARA